MTMKLASFSIGSTGNGADPADYVRIEISPDGGTTYYNTLEINGPTASNAYWGFSTGTGTASTTYDGDASTVTFTPAGTGSRTTDGYSTVKITNLPAVTNLKIRITFDNDAAAERWIIDDFVLSGSCGGVSPSLTGAVIDACSCASVGNEAPGEAIFISSGSYNLDVTTVAQATANVSILYGTPVSASLTVASNCITKSYVNNAAVITCLNSLSGCSGTYIDALGTTIPANSNIMVVRSNFCCSASPENNFSSLCGAGNIYMLFSDDASWSSVGHLKNHGGTLPSDCTAPTNRYFSFVSAAASSTFNANYDACDLAAGGSALPYDGGCVTWGASGGTANLYYNNDCNYSRIILPIDLVDFYSIKLGNSNRIIWEVASEIDVVNYVIEKSNNGIDFFQFGLLPVQKNNLSLKNYSITDNTPYNDVTYYRLGINNNNEDAQYYKIISTDESLNDKRTQLYQENNILTIEFKNTVPKNTNIQLFDLSGKLLVEELVIESQTKINTIAFAEGIYFVKITTPYKSENFKMIIQK